MRQPLVPALFLCLLTSLSACGFHLRGAVVLPPELQVMAVQDAQPSTRIAPLLRRALQAQGVRLVDDAAQPHARLRLLGESLVRRVEAVDNNGRALQYGLRYTVRFSLLGPDGTLWLPPQAVSLRRELRFDETDVLGAGGEQAQLEAEMRREVVRDILRRLSHAAPAGAGA